MGRVKNLVEHKSVVIKSLAFIDTAKQIKNFFTKSETAV